MIRPSAVGGALRVATAGAAGVVLAGAVSVGLVLLSISDAANTSAPGYLPLAWSAAAVLLAVLAVSLFVRSVTFSVSPSFPWFVGLLSFVVSLVPWWAVAGSNPDLGAWMYRGLKVPQGIMQFWDLSLVMLSVDCARWGFDIYQDNNGCMQDASIYAPGMVWLRFIPANIFSESNVPILGVLMMLTSSVVLAWLARQSSGVGQIALAIAAIGGPWLLLLERGNIDGVILWSAVITVILVRRWNTLWAWTLAAVILWLMGTWKYYPFVMGAMLLPVLRLRWGWTVLVGYAVAALGYVLGTWDNLRFSLGSNTAMIDYGDFVVLGRVPVVARMLGTDVGGSSWQLGDLLLLVLVLAAVVWGIGIGMTRSTARPAMAMLALAGSALYLTSILLAGFGYAYKATFLLLALPLLARLAGASQRLLVASGVATVVLITVQSVVVWNTVLATLAGLIAAGFAVGISAVIVLRSALGTRRALPQAGRETVLH